ncbi:MAG: hypothetical protein JJE34_09050 [Alphaproteobacteria bacterium]|nr:hypothetical protein [Alphaproteobacteria bacterium]
MSFAAVISASATVDHDDGLLRATLIFAGQTLVEYQARQAAEAGAGHISIHVSAISAALSQSVDRLTADGINVSLVRSTAELRQTIPPDTDILLIGDGIIAAQSWYAEIARRAAPVLLVVNDRVTEPEFERIDAQHRWAGLARLNFRHMMDTLDTLVVLADWDLQSTLLRHAVQTDPVRLVVNDDALFKGEIILVGTQAAADAAERYSLTTGSIPATGLGWVERYLFVPLADWTIPALLRRQVPPVPLRTGAFALSAAGLVIASYGLTWPALLFFILGLVVDTVAVGMAKSARRRVQSWWRDLICPVLALLGLVLLGSHWRVDQVSGVFTGFYLAALITIVELAIRTGKAPHMRAWMICSLGTALMILLFFRLAGALDIGFAAVTFYALASVAMIVFARAVPDNPQTAIRGKDIHPA